MAVLSYGRGKDRPFHVSVQKCSVLSFWREGVSTCQTRKYEREIILRHWYYDGNGFKYGT